MDRDGTRDGYDLRADARGGRRGHGPGHRLGRRRHPRSPRAPRLSEGGADAVLAASIFHFGEHTIAEAKRAMRARGVRVRIEP